MRYKMIHLWQAVIIFDIILLIESNDLDLKLNRRPSSVYWNAPSFQCKPFKLNFTGILEKYDVIQNENANFRGENIVILYDPGNFPAILKKGNDIFLSTKFKLKHNRRRLISYWNVPSFTCNRYRINFSKILRKYDIIENNNFRFRGDKLVLLYDPGKFPAILKKGKKIFYRNGGVPQEGNLTNHLEVFTEILKQLIPEEEFSGLGIIDFESWRPIYRQNWGSLQPYKTLSEDIEKQKHPLWPYGWIKKEAIRRFEESAKIFMEETLSFAKYLRPNATWGYYHYPYCFNMVSGNMVKGCSKEVSSENDRISWLFNQSDNLYPSVYLQEAYTVSQHVQLIHGRLDEAFRIKKDLNSDKKIYVYYWYKYQDTGNYLSKEDLFVTLTVLASYKIDGVILWGASADVNSKANCLQLYDYIDKVLGPIVKHA